jgi:hypothetical protein
MALLTMARVGAAQNGPPVAAGTVVAPRVEGDVTVPYPTDAHGAAQVVLELLIDAEGNVSRAAALQGAAPFTTAAEHAAAAWHFEPARRGDKAVAARIRFAVTFRDPAASFDPALRSGTGVLVPSGATSPPTATTAPEPREVSITVIGERADHASSLSSSEVRELPGAFGDPFRAIEALPGVTPIATGVPYFYVRGAPPGNVGYFFDGVKVPLLFHAALGPGVLAPWFVDDVKLYSGGYPARYGRFAGGVVAADAAQPRNAWRGMANVRAFDSSAMLEAPFAEGRGNVMLGGRYSYSSAVFSLLSPDFDLGYWDYQARAHYDVTADDRVSVLAFGAYDFASQETNGRKNTIYDATFHRVDARYDRQLSAQSHLRLAATAGSDHASVTTNPDFGLDEQVLTVRTKTIGTRVEYTNRLGKVAELRAGADLTFDKNTAENPYSSSGPNLPPISPHDETNFGARADLVLDLDEVVSVVPGARFDVYHAEGTTLPVVEPRVSARFQVSPSVTLFHDFGLAHQMPSFVVPIPGFQPELGSGLQRSFQMSSGVKTKWPGGVTSTVTVFQNALFNGTDRLSMTGFRQGGALGISPIVPPDARTLGRSVGVELQIKRDLTRRLGGFIAYTLARSVRSVGIVEGPSALDRTHVLNFALGYDLGRHWRAGLRAVFYTGVPAKTAYLAAAASPPRAPPFYRFDWRLEKRWPFTDERYISLVFEFLNVTLNTEVTRLSCSAFYCREERVGPVSAPSIGVEAGF